MSENNEKRRSGKNTLVLAIVLVLVIAGAAIAYPMLTREMGEQSIIPAETAAAPEATQAPAEEQPEAADKTAAPEASAKPADKQEEESAAAGPVQKFMAPDFTMYDKDGNTAGKLSDYRGKPLVVNFFASWCGPCKMEMPHFEEAYKQYGEKIQFLMVNLNGFGGDDIGKALKMVEDGGFTFPVAFDTQGEASYRYSLRSIPVTIFVAPDGELLGKKTGMISKSQLMDTIEVMLEEFPAEA